MNRLLHHAETLCMAFLLALIGWLAWIGPAGAQSTICGPRPGIIEVLADKFGERQHGLGIVNGQSVFEHYLAEDGSWTLIVTNASGISCVVASGTSWEEVPMRVKGEPS